MKGILCLSCPALALNPIRIKRLPLRLTGLIYMRQRTLFLVQESILFIRSRVKLNGMFAVNPDRIRKHDENASARGLFLWKRNRLENVHLIK